MELKIRTFEELTTDELYEILKVRNEVFIVEQNCPYLDIDGIDRNAVHFFFEENDRILACLRAFQETDDKEMIFGRVLSTARRKGYASRLLNEAIAYAKKNGIQTVKIEAQTYAKSLYEKCGFEQTGEEFLLDNIPHISMTLKL